MLSASLTGADALEAWLGEAPAKVIKGIWKATDDGTDEVLKAVQGDTPQLTGALESSEQSAVTHSAQGAIGRIFSKIRYVSFVERGTRQHGPARRMFERGFQSTLNDVSAQYEDMAVKLTESIR